MLDGGNPPRFRRINDVTKRLMAQHTGQSEERIQSDILRDFYMDADMALEYGIVDRIMRK